MKVDSQLWATFQKLPTSHTKFIRSTVTLIGPSQFAPTFLHTGLETAIFGSAEDQHLIQLGHRAIEVVDEATCSILEAAHGK